MRNNFSKEEIDEIIQWDVKNWKNALPFWDAHFDIKPGMKVLALGEREGGLSFYFAKLGCEVYCTDYNEMPDVTQQMHQEKGLADKIKYKQIDIRDIDFEDETFDIVVFKSVLGAITDKAEQDQGMKEVHRVLKKKGAFLFAENTKASKFHGFLRKRFIQWSHRWRYSSLMDFNEWSEVYSRTDSKVYGVFALFGRSEGQRKFLGGIDKIFSPITPKRWKYIYFGVYIK